MLLLPTVDKDPNGYKGEIQEPILAQSPSFLIAGQYPGIVHNKNLIIFACNIKQRPL